MSSTMGVWLVLGGQLLVLLALRSALLLGLGTAVVRSAWAQARRVYRLGFAAGQQRSEALAAVTVLLFDAAVGAAFFVSGAWDFAPLTLSATVFSFLLMFVWYEVWFYVTHRLLHTRWLYRFHAQHHVAKVTTPLTSLSFGLVERAVLLVGALVASALFSRVLPLTLLGVMGYFVFNYLLNVWGHLNVEVMPAGFPRTLLGRFFISTTFHAMHHARYQGHYGLYTQVLDRLFGTYWDDFPAVHARAAIGGGMSQLGARLLPTRAAPDAVPQAALP